MSSLSYTTADSALKEFYLPGVREELNQDTVILSEIEKTSEHMEGRRAVLSLHVSRNHGVGARAELGTLPTAGNQGYAEERVPVYHNYARTQISGAVIDATVSDAGSFIRAVSSELEGSMMDLKRDFNRQIFGTSNGVIATCGVTSAANLVVLAAATTDVQMRQFEVGMRVDIGTMASPTSIASEREITAVDRTSAPPTITIDGAAVTTAGTDFVGRAGSMGDTANSSQKEITGVQTIVSDTGTLFNINPSTYDVWKSTVDDNSGTPRTFTDTLMEKAMDDTSIASGRRQADFLVVTSYGAARNYAAQLKTDRRHNDTVTLKGGFTAISASHPGGTANIVSERDCPAATAYGLSMDSLTLHQTSDWDWMDQDGAVLNRVANTDAYEATLYKRCELATDKRNRHFRINDLTES